MHGRVLQVPLPLWGFGLPPPLTTMETGDGGRAEGPGVQLLAAAVRLCPQVLPNWARCQVVL